MKMINLCIASLFVALAGCDAVDNAIDCSKVCAAYSDCFDSDYDVESCRERCENKAGDDDRFQSKLDACENCIEDLSCTEATFSCATECIGIVP